MFEHQIDRDLLCFPNPPILIDTSSEHVLIENQAGKLKKVRIKCKQIPENILVYNLKMIFADDGILRYRTYTIYYTNVKGIFGLVQHKTTVKGLYEIPKHILFYNIEKLRSRLIVNFRGNVKKLLGSIMEQTYAEKNRF